MAKETYDPDVVSDFITRLGIGKVERRLPVQHHMAPQTVALLYTMALDHDGDTGPVLDRAIAVYAALSKEEREAAVEKAVCYSFAGTLDTHAKEIERLQREAADV